MAQDQNIWQYLEEREDEILQASKALEEELHALRKARMAIGVSARNRPTASNDEKLTIKEMIRNVLSQNPSGGTYDQIINWISETHNVEIARTSLSPQLSRLKADNEVMLDERNGTWRHAIIAPGTISYDSLVSTAASQRERLKELQKWSLEKGGDR